VLLLLLPSSTMGLENEGQRTELTREERERRATIPLLRRLLSERHRHEQQRSKADTRARQEVDELDVYNMERLQVKLEALDLRMDISPHQRMSSSLLLPKTAPPPVRVLLEERPRPVRNHLDSLIISTTGAEASLGLMLNPIQSHLNSLVQVEAGAQLPPFCLVTQDLPQGWLLGLWVPRASENLLPNLEPSPCRFLRDGYEKDG
jgi:hypothetical protein